MAVTRDIIKKAVDKARDDWEVYSLTQEQELIKIFEDSAAQIERWLFTQTSMSEVKYAHLQALHANITQELASLRRHMYSRIHEGMNTSIDMSIEDLMKSLKDITPMDISLGTSYFDSSGVLHKFNRAVESYAASQWAVIHDAALDFVMRYRPEGFTLSQNIWNVTYQTQRQLFNRIGIAVTTGESAHTLAVDIRRLLGVSTSKALSQVTRELIRPGKGVYRDMLQNALRVARTEMNRAYVEAGHRYMMQKDFIIGVIHRTASGNPCPICEDLEGTFYERGTFSTIPVHPNCLCYEEYVLAGEEGYKEYVKEVAEQISYRPRHIPGMCTCGVVHG